MMTTTTTYRIGRIEDWSVPAQFVAPLTCYLLSAFAYNDVPIRFRCLRGTLTDVEVSREKYIAEVVRLMHVVPNSFKVDSVLLNKTIADGIEGKCSDAVRMYILAYLIPRREAYVALVPKAKDNALNTFVGVCAGIANKRELARTRVDLILRSILKLDLDNRFYVVSRAIDAPFFIPHGNEHVIMSMAHYHPPFVAKFRQVVAPFVRSGYLDRMHELVTLDFNVFASALARVPPRGSVSTIRMEHEMFGTEGHPEAGRIVWAFCSIWFDQCVTNTFGAQWNLSPETMRRMWRFAKEGRTMTVHEATRPFGSSICKDE
jgi:hypothetical protein